MAYYWRAEDVPELGEVPRADRELWWHIAREQSRSGFRGRLAGWLSASPWVCLVLAFSDTSRRYLQSPFAVIACVAVFVSAVLALDICLNQPRRRRWLRERMREYQRARPWLQASPIADAPANGNGTPAHCWRLGAIPELHNLPRERMHKLWREAVSRSATPQGMLRTMLVVFMVGVVAGGASLLLLPAISPLWAMLPAIACASFVAERWFRWPAARCWLREHAHELDRYVPV